MVALGVAAIFQNGSRRPEIAQSDGNLFCLSSNCYCQIHSQFVIFYCTITELWYVKCLYQSQWVVFGVGKTLIWQPSDTIACDSVNYGASMA